MPDSVFFGIWGTAVLAWAALSYQYRKKWQSHGEGLAQEIRNHNSGRYDQSIGRKKLADEFRNPWRVSHMQEFAENNGKTAEEYEDELRNKIGNPMRLYWAVLYHIFGFAITIVGIVYLGLWNLPYAIPYLMAVWTLFFASYGLFWYL